MAHDFKAFPELLTSQLTEFYFDSPHKQIFEDFNARVTKVTDGDTIRVKWGERDFDFPVRFANISAAELNEEGGERSRDWLAERIEGEDVLIMVDPSNRVGKFGRLIGEVIHRGLNINELSMAENQSIDFSSRADQPLQNFDKILKGFSI